MTDEDPTTDDPTADPASTDHDPADGPGGTGRIAGPADGPDSPGDYLRVADAAGSLDRLLARAAALKETHRAGRPYRHLPGRTLAMLFEHPSTRTRISFEAGTANLGGHALVLTPDQLQLGRGEPIADTARVLSGYVDAVMARLADHGDLLELAEHATVPVINGLTDRAHPVQTLADLLTVHEAMGGFEGVTAAWVGDGNNVAASFAAGCALAGIDLTVATPEGYELPPAAMDAAARLGGVPTTTADPVGAVADADVVYTDVWVSMGDDAAADGSASKVADFDGFQVNGALLDAGDDPYVMHCLPAHRGEEITAAVLEGERSLVWEQAENRMHTQNALLVELLETEGAVP